MRRAITARSLAVFIGLFATVVASATMVQQMNLGELAFNADKIFRGTVISVERDTVMAGGSELDTTKVVVRVTEMLKGEAASANGKVGDIVEFTMLGSLKQPEAENGLQRVNAFTPPNLRSGQEYLLFTTAPSNLGLSITVGLGQGAFQFVDSDNVINEAKNAGLFRDMDSQGMPARGPVPYEQLSQRIRSIVGN